MHATETSVVIPAFNEGGRIEQTLAELQRALPQFVPEWEIRVVDDGSSDDTASIVERAARRDPRIVLQSEAHRGKGATVRAGLLRATADLRFMCDADLSMPVAEIPRFLAVVPSECDVAIGTREGVGARRVGEPAYRHLLGRAFNSAVRAMVLPGIRDSQCGFKMFTADAVERIFPRTTLAGWAFDVEVLFMTRRLGLRLKEVPLEWHFREQSRVSAIRDSLGMFRDLRTIRRNARRGLYDLSVPTLDAKRGRVS